jgi:hypothetical protein
MAGCGTATRSKSSLGFFRMEGVPVSPDEALKKICATRRCFVIFDVHTGELLEVHPQSVLNFPLPPGIVDDLLRKAASTHGQVAGRYLDGATTTLRSLVEQVANQVEESRRAAIRDTLLSRWATLGAADLVGILEAEGFAPPLSRGQDERFVVERIFDYPPDVLVPLVPRLEHVAKRPIDDRPLEGPARTLLNLKLAVLAGDFAQLKAALANTGVRRIDRPVVSTQLLECLGNLRPSDVIELLIETVSRAQGHDVVESHREALRSLGKVGTLAGSRAARAIRDNPISERRPDLAELRERVLTRIESAEDAWTRCPRCYWGKVPGRPRNEHFAHCAMCLGLGVIPRAASGVAEANTGAEREP